MLAITEDPHASDNLKSVNVTDIELIQRFLARENVKHSDATQAVKRLQKKLDHLKQKNTFFNHIMFSNHIAPLI